MAPVVAALVVVACHAGVPSNTASLADRLDIAARICAKVASCAHEHDAPRDRDPAACVEAWMARAPEAEPLFGTCVLAANGCAGVDACDRHRGDPATTAFCRAHPGARTGCDGNHLVSCSQDDPSESSVTDCAAFGATCGDLPQAGGLLGHGCLSPRLCPRGAPEVRCDGTGAVVACHEGIVERSACSDPARCEEHRTSDGAVSATCESPDPRRCEAVGKRWCERGRLVQCQPHAPSEASVTDCAALGLACDEHADSGPACVAPGPPACEHAAPRCEGDALTFCAAGRRLRVACGSLGLGACDPDAHGVDAACGSSPRVAAPASASAP